MLKFNNRMLKYNSRWLNETMIPIDLPPNTVRLRYIDGITPTAGDTFLGSITLTQISSIPNIWDITYVNSESGLGWYCLLSASNAPNTKSGYGSGLLEIIAANISDVTNLTDLCYGCKSLYKVCDLNLSSALSATEMFAGCINLIQVGSIDMRNVRLMNNMFNGCKNLPVIPNIVLPSYNSNNNCYQMFYACYKVTSGSLNLYNRLKNIIDTSSIGNYLSCFHDCGRDTVTGAAELAQIPNKWK